METQPLLSPIVDGEEASIIRDEFDAQFKSDKVIPKATGPQGKRGVNALQLTMMIYFFTSGGPFGIESSVEGAGPLLVLISLILIPLVWSLPQALMSAELSLMIDENGGNVVWVRRAFGKVKYIGDFIGFNNAYNNVIQSIFSLGLLAVLFESYIPIQFSIWESWLVRGGFILFNTVLNILGLRWISRLSIFFLIFVLSPFIAEFIIVLIRHDIDSTVLAYIPPKNEIDWGLFLSTVIWSYGGFDSMGSLAGEVKGGRKTFMLGIILSFPLIFVNYFLPIFFGYSIDPHYRQWTNGYFTQIAYDVNTRGNYLGKWMIAASALSNFGQFNAAMAPNSRVIWAMAKIGYVPSILGWSWQRHTGTIRPIASVIFLSIVTIGISGVSYGILVQIYLMIRVINLFWEYGALVMLRYTEPDTHRPFVVPGGLVGAWLIGVPTIALATFTLVDATPVVWISGAITNVAILVLYFVRLGILKLIERNQPRHVQRNSTLN